MISRLLILFIRFYQLAISPFLAPACRFEPSCSRYTITCIERFGPFFGIWLGIKRICRCHPFGGHGFDPPPPVKHYKGNI